MAADKSEENDDKKEEMNTDRNGKETERMEDAVEKKLMREDKKHI